MLQQATTRILRAPVSFFDTTPLGRITNRFSKDIDVMDNFLTESMRLASITLSMVIGTIALTIAYYYYFAIALVPICIIYISSALFYRASARELKRHEAVLRSSVFARFSEAITGTSTLRAYGVEKEFSNKLTDAIDDMDSAYFLTFANQRWLCVRLDAIGVIFVVVTGMLVVTNKFSVPPSISGLVLSYLIAVTQLLQFSVRQAADVQNNMNATERLHTYGYKIPQEASAETQGFKLPDQWPEQGEITFTDVKMRYRSGLPLVLHGLTLQIEPGERLGVVGRTGAGKSSIMATLFRMVELASGSIKIDGIDISTVGLHDLRSRMSIIPQDPTLFRGTIRSNLDPFNQHTDMELWAALRQANLVDEEDVAKQSDNRITLQTSVEAEGTNFSLGQRQLMAIARALIRNPRIIVCDEATSSIDFESDRKIQQAMAHGFKGKTLVCIAHRLKTIIGYDRVCVVEDGLVIGLGTPAELYAEGGKFRQMCDGSQIGVEEIESAQTSARLGY
jgi:ATP-binding cassette subfamily C (CFTR/MRP) protein 1